ncbi:hypothetical protein C8T65DRAFT_20847 [Cerioporus squamosus]|nr:hypothetical protein C8T65DRAFT_20847 [Cerioporus squamosus]
MGISSQRARWSCIYRRACAGDVRRGRGVSTERFIRDRKQDPVFGSSCRICPGRCFAQVGPFITVASVLHVFDMTPPCAGHAMTLEGGSVIRSQ